MNSKMPLDMYQTQSRTKQICKRLIRCAQWGHPILVYKYRMASGNRRNTHYVGGMSLQCFHRYHVVFPHS